MSEIIVPGTYDGLRLLGPWISSLTESLGPDVALGLNSKVELAIHELATNSIDHANSASPSITFRGSVDSVALRIELVDHGDEVDLEAIPTPDIDEPQIRGYGMMIVEQLVSSLDYQRVDDRNIWTAVFDLPDEPTDS